MVNLKLVSATLRMSNETVENRAYKITAGVSVNEENTVTGIYNGMVARLDTEVTIAAFEYRNLFDMSFQFNGLPIDEQKSVMDECHTFLASLKSATVNVSVATE